MRKLRIIETLRGAMYPLRVLAWLTLLTIPAWPTVARAADQVSTPKGILVLYYYGKDYPANVEFEQGVLATLKSTSPGSFEYYPEYLEPNRFPGKLQSAAFQDYLRKKYADHRIDVVIAQTDIALTFLLQYRRDLFPNSPILFFARKRPDIGSQFGEPGYTGVIADHAYQQTLDLALTLHPRTKRVYVITGTPDNDPTLATIVQDQLRPFESRLEVIYLTNLPLEEMLARVRNAPQESIILYVRYSQDEPGKALGPREILALVAQSSSVPIYGIAEGFVGHGIVGGYLFRHEEAGKRLAEMALQIAGGARTADVPIEKARLVPMFDWRQLRRWNIPEGQLPTGSVIRFKEPTLWEQYKWRIVGAGSLIIFQALLIIWLLINRAQRQKAEEASRASEQRYRNVVETQTELICRYLPDTTLTFVNEAYCREFGKTHDQLIGTKFVDLMPEQAREAALAHVTSLIENPRVETYEHEVVLPNGGRGWQQWVDNVVGSLNGHGLELQGIGRDITEKRQAEEELRLSEMRFRHMADTSEIFIWIADANMLCTYFNRRVLAFTGRTMEELVGEGWLEIIHQDDVQLCVDAYTAGYEKREPFVLEFRIRRADGEFRWIYDTGAPRFSSHGELIGYIGSAVDITDRRTAEEALQIAHQEVSKLKNQLEAENVYLQEEIKLAHNVDEIVGKSNAIKYVLYKIEQVSETDTTVLILGETGTGKELVARAIHSHSLRKNRPLVKVNCAALSASLIESELFGHEKGAFTGAGARKVGRFELADGATLFLDEIGELPLELQPKLLRVLQEGELERLGSNKTLKVDVRIIAATNRNLTIEVEKGTFREDLWYRLNVFPITVPPLRQRKEDIPGMVEHFVALFSKKLGKAITSISAATLKKLQDHFWPGNVRELANVLERGVINAQGSVLHIADQFDQSKTPDPVDSNQTLEEIEREHITHILDQTAWRIEGPRGAARILGLNPSTLRTRMLKLGIDKSIRSFSAGSETTR